MAKTRINVHLNTSFHFSVVIHYGQNSLPEWNTRISQQKNQVTLVFYSSPYITRDTMQFSMESQPFYQKSQDVFTQKLL